MENFIIKSFFVCGVFQIAVGLQFPLDSKSDMPRGSIWTLSGDLQYADSGKELRRAGISQFLPDNFTYSSFEKTKGIWVLGPNKNKACPFQDDDLNWSFSTDVDDDYTSDSNDTDTTHSSTSRSTSTTTTERPCDISSVASFRGTLRAQRMSSVAVWYNSGGNATIRITGGRSRHPFEIPANFVWSDTWKHFKMDVDASSVLLEAIVNKTGDYILIDKIIVESQDTTTTHRPTKSTTHKHPTTTSVTTPITTPTTHAPSSAPTEGPSPASGQSGVLTGLSPVVTLASTLLTIIIVKSISV